MFKELNILKPFLEEPLREYNVREVAKILKVSPATASKKLRGFARESVLVHRKERNLDLYRANLEGDSYLDIKIYYNVRKVRDSGIIEGLNDFYMKPAVVLFGSASSGLDTQESDFDFLIISEKTGICDMKRHERKLNRGIQLFVYKNTRQIKNRHLANSMMNGIVLQGDIEWI
jgi:predicted nucleotidyltransferase